MTSSNEIDPAKSKAAFDFALDLVQQLPKDDPEALEAHLTGVLIVFWGALWGTLGTEYARGFIESQLAGMADSSQHERWTAPRMQ